MEELRKGLMKALRKELTISNTFAHDLDGDEERPFNFGVFCKLTGGPSINIELKKGRKLVHGRILLEADVCYVVTNPLTGKIVDMEPANDPADYMIDYCEELVHKSGYALKFDFVMSETLKANWKYLMPEDEE